MKYIFIFFHLLIIVLPIGCSNPEQDHANAEISLQKIRNKEDSISDWRILVKQINNSDAGYSLQIIKKCHEVFVDFPPADYANFRKLSKEDQELILQSIHYGSPDYLR